MIRAHSKKLMGVAIISPFMNSIAIPLGSVISGWSASLMKCLNLVVTAKPADLPINDHKDLFLPTGDDLQMPVTIKVYGSEVSCESFHGKPFCTVRIQQ